MKTLLFNLVFVGLCMLLLSLWGFYSAIRPSKIVSTVTPKNYGVPYEDTEFLTSDGIKIRGWFVPAEQPSKKVVIMLHGYPMDKGDILPSRLFLRDKYNLLFIDFRFLGASGGKYSTVGKNEVLDVVAAVQFLRQRGMTDIGIWGFSMGGGVALMAAKAAPEVKAVVAEAGYARLSLMARDYFHIPLLKYPLAYLLNVWSKLILGMDINKVSPVDDALTLHIPVMIINSKNDAVVTIVNANLFQQVLAKNKNVRLLLFDDVPHGGQFKDYQKIIEEFFSQNL